MKLQVKKNLVSVLAFVGFIWLVYLINLPLQYGEYNLNRFGLEPRTLHGLVGIFTMPFLHDGLNHLLGNTVPLAVLLLMLAFTRPNPKRIIVCLTVMSGVMLWLLGRPKIHVGASALIYALTAYLMAAGFYERKVASAVAAILVGVLYGGTLFWGLLPTAGAHVSWEGHLLGAIAGGLFAAQTTGRSGRKALRAVPAGESPIVSDSTV
ncbi:MAG: rhomboid family intramembrane serine protease [Planctomycetaceae bacterium]|nr:rhomboid family intramembrane serine protease [Planctomycetaceae bacterium]